MKDLNPPSSQGVSRGVKNSNPRYEGHILLLGTKYDKVCFFLCSETVCWPFVDVAKLAINNRL